MKNVLKLRSSILNIEKDENDILIIGFSEDDTFKQNLIIQYSEELTDDDIENGWTRYYLEYNNMGSYSCLDKVTISSRKINFTLNKTGKELFKEDEIEITLQLEKDLLYNLKSTLEKIFEKESVKLEVRD